jgi:cell division protein ZapA (FtsZ GTPase activity inhibitor)
MSELIAINVVIADRTYRIKIAPEDEETVRGIVRLINEKFMEFKTEFAGKDIQDYISMVILWYATRQKEMEKQPIPEDLSKRLNEIEFLLDEKIGQ